MSEPEVANFPKPKTWATFVYGRSENFKMHSTLGLAKSSLVQSDVRPGNYGRSGKDAWVYRWNADLDAWEEFAFIEAGNPAHPFWEMKNPGRSVKTLSETAVNQALASIAEAARRQS